MKLPFIKILFILSTIAMLNSCIALRLRYKEKNQSHKEISNELAKKFKNSILLYRTPEYLQVFKDSTCFNIGNFTIYNKNGHQLTLYDTSKFDICSIDHRYQAITRYKPSLISLGIEATHFDSMLLTLNTFENQSIKFNQLGEYEYYVFMDWNTFMKHRQNKLYRKMKYLTSNEKILFVMLNKDFLLNDSVTKSLNGKVKIRTNFKY